MLLAPPTSAETSVYLLPAGEHVTVFIGGVWQNVTEPFVLRGPAMISTGDSEATVVLHDDGVFRLAPNTTLKIHDIADHPETKSLGPTATLVRGQLWTLGLLPPVVEGIELETSAGILSLNAGSASIYQDASRVSVIAYDKGVTFVYEKTPIFLVSGEKVTFMNGRASSIITLPARAFADPYIADNLSQDAVHRADIAHVQQKRRAAIAGILPTSIFYPAKRMAEEVDVLFTLTHDGRTEKRLQQVNTRLSEAIALLKNGQQTEAEVSLQTYSQSLLALASEDQDNIVKELIKKQLADASATLTASDDHPQLDIALVTDAMSRVGAALPDTNLRSIDIQGYVLVDKLAQINRVLLQDHDLTAAVTSYAAISPYLKDILSEGTGAHPLLQKEARSLLLSTSSLLSTTGTGDIALRSVMEKGIAQYLPAETDKILVNEDALHTEVSAMVERILVFRHPRSRYNQLLTEFRNVEAHPNRGTLLRRLKNALPLGLGEYVNTEMKNLRDELRD
jgi:hypothetical protein